MVVVVVVAVVVVVTDLVWVLFKAVGCPTPKMPKQGYRVNGNSSHAQFMCCVDHVFPDTGLRLRNLTCQEGYRWSEDLPDCVGKFACLSSFCSSIHCYSSVIRSDLLN